MGNTHSDSTDTVPSGTHHVCSVSPDRYLGDCTICNRSLCSNCYFRSSFACRAHHCYSCHLNYVQSNAVGMLDDVDYASDYLYACDIPRSRYDVCGAPCTLTEGKCALMTIYKDRPSHGFCYYDSALVRQHLDRSKGRSYAHALHIVLLCYTSSAHGDGDLFVQCVPLELMLLILAFFGRTTIVRPACISEDVVEFTLDMDLVIHGPIIRTRDAIPIPRIVVRDLLRMMNNKLTEMHSRAENAELRMRSSGNASLYRFHDRYTYARRVLAIAYRDLVHHWSLELTHSTCITTPCRGSEAKYQITVEPRERGSRTRFAIYSGCPGIAILYLNTAADGGFVSCVFAVLLDK